MSYSDTLAGYGLGDSDRQPNNIADFTKWAFGVLGSSYSGLIWSAGRLKDLVDAGGGSRTFTAKGKSFTLTIPVRPSEPLQSGYEWHFYANPKDGHVGWWQKKKGGGFLHAVGSVIGTVAKVALPIASIALPVVGAGAGAIKAVTTAKNVTDTVTGVTSTVKNLSTSALPATPPTFQPQQQPIVYQQPGGTMVTDVRPGGMPSWLLPAGVAVLAVLALDRR
jgi:hypothetical protein